MNSREGGVKLDKHDNRKKTFFERKNLKLFLVHGKQVGGELKGWGQWGEIVKFCHRPEISGSMDPPILTIIFEKMRISTKITIYLTLV